MLKFILKRLVVEALPTLLVLVTLTFFMVRLAPGGPFSKEKTVSEEVMKNLEAHYGLDQSMGRQYLNYLGGLLSGNLGPSFKYTNQTVNELIGNAFPVSFQLGSLALLYALLLGMSAGLLAAWKPNTWADYLPMSLAMVGICVPAFVLGPLLALLFGLQLEWVNVAGWRTASDRILPTITLGTAYAAYIARLTRGGMLEVMTQDFIRTARAKGLPERLVVLRHALRGGVLPVISFLGPAVAGMISGSFVVETIFFIPGLGRTIVDGAFNRDYFLVQGAVLFFGFLMILFNLVADILQAWLNPKLREGGA